jgi:hypothetical protein
MRAKKQVTRRRQGNDGQTTLRNPLTIIRSRELHSSMSRKTLCLSIPEPDWLIIIVGETYILTYIQGTETVTSSHRILGVNHYFAELSLSSRH